MNIKTAYLNRSKAVLILAVSLFFVQCKQIDSIKVDDISTLSTIFNRHSVRQYTDKKVEPEKIEILLRAAMASPTALNKQPWKFIVIDDRTILDQMKEKMPYIKMLETANTAIVVCGDLSKAPEGREQEYWIQDCSAATQNLLLAAHSLDLGAVWVGLYPRVERGEVLREILDIPSNLVPLNIIPVGYPAGKGTPKDKWNPENVSYNGWR
ncbi:MAG: nitroreductase family protein [Tannerellaceae bacterium]